MLRKPLTNLKVTDYKMTTRHITTGLHEKLFCILPYTRVPFVSCNKKNYFSLNHLSSFVYCVPERIYSSFSLDEIHTSMHNSDPTTLFDVLLLVQISIEVDKIFIVLTEIYGEMEKLLRRRFLIEKI